VSQVYVDIDYIERLLFNSNYVYVNNILRWQGHSRLRDLSKFHTVGLWRLMLVFKPPLQSQSSKPLEGVRLIELTGVLAGGRLFIRYPFMGWK
jgi:hypothetical protein